MIQECARLESLILELKDKQKGIRRMSSEEKIKIEGTVKELLSNGLYKVEIGNNNHITGHLSGRMRMNNIRILQGDIVSLEMSPYDMTKGRITFRKK